VSQSVDMPNISKVLSVIPHTVGPTFVCYIH